MGLCQHLNVAQQPTNLGTILGRLKFGWSPSQGSRTETQFKRRWPKITQDLLLWRFSAAAAAAAAAAACIALRR